MLSRLVLGTAQLGAAYGVAGRSEAPSAREVDDLLAAAVDRGVRGLDTAPGYGDAEQRIGRFLARRPDLDDLEIGTKLPPIPKSAAGDDVGEIVAAAVGASLGRLGVPRIARYLVHRPADLQRHGRRLLDALAREVASGRVARCGVSVYEPAEAAAVLEYPELTVVQHPLNLFDRRLLAGGWLRRLQRAKVEVEARSVLLQGLLALDPRVLPERVAHARPALQSLASALREYDLPARDAALAFVAGTGVDRIVLGVDSVEQLEANLEALRRPLPDGLAGRLAAVLPVVPEAVFDPRAWPEQAP